MGAALLAGCSAGSGDLGGSVGSQGGKAPVAVILSVGHPQESDGSVVVRSGAEVLLSGEDSDSRDAPILSFEWEGLDPAAQQVMSNTVLRPTANAIKFPAPAVPVGEEANLRFRLTVTNSRGQAGTSEIAVKVQGVADPGAFLTYVQGDASELVVVAALKDGATPPGADAFFRVVMRQEIAYKDKLERDRTLVLPDVVRTGAWLAEHDPDSDCAAQGNARMSFPMPVLNADTINGVVQRAAYALPKDQRQNKLNEETYLVDMDEATLVVRFDLTASSAEPVVLDPSLQGSTRLCVVGPNGHVFADSQVATNPISLQDEIDSLRERLNPSGTGFFDTRDSAQEYYSRVDPRGYRTTLEGWLNLHGFDTSRRDLGAANSARGVVRAAYLNNYDLGFGREMYSRLVCDTDTADPAPGDCDVASVVFNYPSSEGAAKQLGAFVAVAMEYSRSEFKGGCVPNPDDPLACVHDTWSGARNVQGPRFTKFFVFAPDPRTGSFDRVTSANLDGRGEKSVPQSCTVCHGGVPYRASKKLALNGKATGPENVEAGFLPWDDDNLLFGSEDGAAFKQAELSEADEDLLKTLSRTAQAGAIRQLNRHAWLTYKDPDYVINRFNDARELVLSWYGAGFANAAQADSRPKHWELAPADAYDGYARYCRTCHILQAPQSLDLPGQYAFSTYDELRSRLANAGTTAVMHAGLMPAARLSFDRFWTRDAGSLQSPGERFWSGLFSNEQIEAPGHPVPEVRVASGAISRASPTLLEGAGSRFVTGFHWSATDVLGQPVSVRGAARNRASLALPGYCRPLNQDGSAREAIDDKVLVRLEGTNDLGQSRSVEVNVPILNIQPAAQPPGSRTVFRGQFTTFSFPELFQQTGSDFGDGIVQYAPACSGGDCSVSAAGVQFQAHAQASAGSISVVATDCDGDSAIAKATVTVIEKPAVNGRTWDVRAGVTGDLEEQAGAGPGSVLSNDTTIPGASQPVVMGWSYSPVTPCTVNPKRIDCELGNPQVIPSSLSVSAAGIVTYAPPRGVITRGDTANDKLPPMDSFSYHFRQFVGEQPVLTDPGVELIQISGTVKYSDLEDQIRGNPEKGIAPKCTGCHGSYALNASAKNRMCLVEGQLEGFGTGDSECPAPTGSRARNSFYESLVFQYKPLVNAADADDPAGTSLRINIANPGQAELYTHPTTTGTHTGNLALNDFPWVNLRKWIEEGAWQN